MNTITIITIIASVIIIAAVIALILSLHKTKIAREELGRKVEELGRKETEIRELTNLVSEQKEDIIRKEAEAGKAEALRENDKKQHEQAIAEIKESHEKAIAELKVGHEKAIESAKTALALENEKILKAREESLKKEAAETMKNITGGLDQNIKDMKEAFEAQKKSHAEESSAIKTQFSETVKHLKEQAEVIGNQAEDLTNVLRGQNKFQGIFGETILENILKGEGLRDGHDYDSEFWLRDKKGNLIINEETGKKMRPDFALHFPDNTDILIDSKVSLKALVDYTKAKTDEERTDAAARNLASVENHIKELTSKEYQKYVVGRKTLDYVIMFIPNYGAYQLAKMEDKDIFAKAFRQNVLITTEETLIPFLRLIRTAWVQKERMENISEIVAAAQNMVDRVALFCEENAKLESSLDSFVKKFKQNSARLVESDQSIVGAARKAIEHGISMPTKHVLPPTVPALLPEKQEE